MQHEYETAHIRTVDTIASMWKLPFFYIADEIVIDGNRFTDCEIMEMPSVEEKFANIGLIGMGFLQLFTVYFDFD